MDSQGKPRERESRSPARMIAVALEYDHGRFPAPVVSATGKGEVAERILALAREHHVPICQDPQLAEMLSTLDLAEAIPPELYAVVAEVFAFIYRLEATKREANRRDATSRKR